jgi:predicted HNH restriction endonuclease
MTQEQHKETHGRKLHVHHIIPARQFKNAQRRNRTDNLITFCVSCHRRWEGIPLKPDT